MKSFVKMLLGSSLLAAVLPLMCCFIPALLSVVAGLGFISRGFQWVHPAELYLTLFSVGSLGVAHYKNFEGSKRLCRRKSCQDGKINRGINSWSLWIITSLVLISMIVNFWHEF